MSRHRSRRHFLELRGNANCLVDHEFGGSAEIFVVEGFFIKFLKCSVCGSDIGSGSTSFPAVQLDERMVAR